MRSAGQAGDAQPFVGVPRTPHKASALFGQKRNLGSSVDFSVVLVVRLIFELFFAGRSVRLLINHRTGCAATSAAIRTTARSIGRAGRPDGLAPVPSFSRPSSVVSGANASITVDACPS